jgi:hypothetical protein
MDNYAFFVFLLAIAVNSETGKFLVIFYILSYMETLLFLW